MKQAVFFDLDDTLLWDIKSVHEALDETCKLAGQSFSIDPSQLRQVVVEEAPKLYQTFPTYPFARMIGTGAFEALWADYLEGEGFEGLRQDAPVYRREVWYQSMQKCGVDDREFADQLAECFIRERKQRSYVYDDTYVTLDLLKEQGFGLLLLTNGSPDLQRTKLDGEPRLAKYFDHIVISGNVGRGKPDPVIFEHALSLVGMKASDVVMVGDKLSTDVLGANRSGIDSVWLNRDHNVCDGEINPKYEIQQLSQLFPIIQA